MSHGVHVVKCPIISVNTSNHNCSPVDTTIKMSTRVSCENRVHFPLSQWASPFATPEKFPTPDEELEFFLLTSKQKN